ncbi:MAG: hypothetical protein H6767_01710 [Candidatus Peribacteria bacterium]|nr:MAG: hypothetical protein H6767_01710 [Candidatus Peribacteria bacterium]
MKAWKEKFVEKHGDFNLLHIKDLSEVDSNFLQENLTAPSFFGAKKLVIVDGVPFQSGEKDKQMLEKQDLILRLLSRVPDDNFVVFSSVSPDKRSTAYKEMLKIAEVKEYSLSDSGEVERKISELYRGVIDLDAIRLLVRYTGGNFEKAIHEIEKLMITRNTITRNDIQRYVTPELEESIFQLVDMLLEGNTHRAIQMMHTILDQTNVYGFYHNLLANLRTNTYIALVKSQRKDPRQVLDLGNK